VQRVLDPAQIEAFAEREIPRIRLPARAEVFAKRASRLRLLSESERAGHGRAIRDYLRLMAVVADAQQSAIASVTTEYLSPEGIRRAHRLHMPPLEAVGLRREAPWRDILTEICGAVGRSSDIPADVRDLCARLRHASAAALETQADALLAVRMDEVDVAAAPFVMGALQVYWAHMTGGLCAADVHQLEVPGICPVCGSLPVASVVRVDKASQGYRYLHCVLCATEWHMVRVTCTRCQATKDLSYHSIEHGSEAIRAESCSNCRCYRKIFYQEKDASVEPVADDLASLALDLLMTAEDYHRASGNPLLWLKQPST
jgi:FdhE protein